MHLELYKFHFIYVNMARNKCRSPYGTPPLHLGTGEYILPTARPTLPSVRPNLQSSLQTLPVVRPTLPCQRPDPYFLPKYYVATIRLPCENSTRIALRYHCTRTVRLRKSSFCVFCWPTLFFLKKIRKLEFK